MVIIDGASGGVGMVCIELAKAMGAKVIAGVSHVDKMSFPKSVGADYVFCYGRGNKDTNKMFKNEVKKSTEKLDKPEGVDIVIDLVKWELFERALLSCVRQLGTICLLGLASSQKHIRPGIILVKEVKIVGSLCGRWENKYISQYRKNVENIIHFMEKGVIKSGVFRIFSFKNYWKAFEVYEKDKGQGNTVIHIKW